ncbi:MAG: hypothetical protein GX334_02275 [Firmicutes bacterium]|nr:hypothetical protein [Bacillota bacterium]
MAGFTITRTDDLERAKIACAEKCLTKFPPYEHYYNGLSFPESEMLTMIAMPLERGGDQG